MRLSISRLLHIARVVVFMIGLALVAPGAEAAVITYTAMLAPEIAGSSGSGSVTVIIDTTAAELFIDANFTGLTGTTTQAHIHCCVTVPGTGTVGVAVTPGTLTGFPVGVSSGSYTNDFDLTLSATYTAAFLGSDSTFQAMARLVDGLNDGRAYFNIHTTFAPGGEIRGFLEVDEDEEQVPVPEPASVTLLGLGLAGLGARRWRQRKPAN